jgi:osmotically-inducible protein OsmY
VRLEGKVEWQYERDRAEAAVRRPLGVVGVSNLIELKPRASASQIKEKVEQAFKRSAQIDADERIQVEVNGSEAILKGQVRSFAEREEAERAAWLAPGVTQVDDRLVVSY